MAGAVSGGPMVLTADRVWTGRGSGTGGDLIEHGFVRTEGGRIIAVGRQAELGSAAEGGTARVDLPGATILPGLVNAHAHLVLSASEDPVGDLLDDMARGAADLAVRAVANLQAATRAGVTTVRDLGGPNEVVFAVRDAVDRRHLAGAARVVASGAPITITGGHCHWFSHECDTADEVRRAVRQQVKAGADLVKIFATGGNLTPRTNPFAPQYTAAELAACVEEATRLGVQVASHAHAPEGIRRSAAARVSTIEHCFFETRDGVGFDPATAEAMARDRVAFVPTFGQTIHELRANPDLATTPTSRRILAKFDLIVDALRKLRAAGAPMVFGNDAGIPRRVHAGFAADLIALAHPDALGLEPVDALRAVTSSAAAHLGLDDCGVLVAGRRADVLAVDGNPLTSLEDLTRTRFVLAGGSPVALAARR